MNKKERAILNLMQDGIPLVSRPFKVIAEKLGTSEEEAFEIFSGLKNRGLIRRFGGIVNIAELGIASTLIGVKVADEHIQKVAEQINALTGVTHNYQREDAYNLWFTLMEKTPEKLAYQISIIEKIDEVQALINLPSKNKYKTKVVLKV